MINHNSRYSLSTVDHVVFKQNGPNNVIVFYDFDSLDNMSFTLHTYVQGERLEQIAARYYNGRSDMWWVIPEYNPEVKDFFKITPGTVLRIPRV